jgi:predicted O-methyltransferase YrrM
VRAKQIRLISKNLYDRTDRMKGRDWLALAVDRILPGRGRRLLAEGVRNLAVAGRHDLGRVLADADLAEAFATALRDQGFQSVSEATAVPDCRALFQIAAALAPMAVLEIGTHVGASTLHIAAALRHAGGGTLTTVDLVDVNAADGPWSKRGAPASPRVLTQRLGLEAFVSFQHCTSGQFFALSQQRFDLIWIDGSHSQVPAFLDIRNALGSLASGGLICSTTSMLTEQAIRACAEQQSA